MASRGGLGCAVGAVMLAIAGLAVTQAPVAGAVPGNPPEPVSAHVSVDVSRGDFAGRVEIGGGRRLYLECRGQGSPTVVLESGGGDAADVWSLRKPDSHQTPVMPAVARYTRVCAYDRPGTTQASSGQPSRSDPVPLPRPISAMVEDLHALLAAADVPGPYVLVGHSLGGLVSRLYAGTYSDQVVGFVSVDAAHEILYEAWEALLPREEYQKPGAEIDVVATAGAMRRARVEQPLRPMPMIVLEHSRNAMRFPNPLAYPPTWPVAPLERAFQTAQDDLTQMVPGARHIIAQQSEHNIHVDQPVLVNRSIRQVVAGVRRDARRPGA
jgi:pimeloyl-ACP methyl ester carboxylesterase